MDIYQGSHLQYGDGLLLRLLNNGELDPQYFNHEVHLRLAWISLQQNTLEGGIRQVCESIMRYVTHLGARDKFHKTLTIAASYAVYHFMIKSKTTTFQEFIAEFPQLNHQLDQLLSTHYSYNIVESSVAKEQYVKPDLEPFYHLTD